MPKVLILDDRDDYLRALTGALRRSFDVVTAQTVSDAQQVFDADIDVTLIDVRLSEHDASNREGLTFLAWLKNRSTGTPALMMSGYSDREAMREAFELGADYFLRKPIDLRELRRLLAEFAKEGSIPTLTAQLRHELEQER